MSLHENEDPIYGLDVVPFLATSFDQAKKLWDVQRPAVEKKLASQGLMLLAVLPPQGIFAKKDINTIEDLKGVKWRSYNPGTACIAEIVSTGRDGPGGGPAAGSPPAWSIPSRPRGRPATI